MIFIKNSKPRKSSEKLDRFSLQNQLLVIGTSCFEIEIQLLTFRKDILTYKLMCHLIFQNRNGNMKVAGADWCVKSWRFVWTGKL